MIRITDRLAVMSDETQFLVGEVKKRINKNSGEEVEYIYMPAYCDKLSQAVKYCLRKVLMQKVAAGEITSLESYLKELQNLERSISEKLSALDG